MASDPLILRATDYGVVGDGTTDDTAAMQALFDAAEALSAAIVFVNIAGDIKLTSTLVLNDTTTATHVSIEGMSEVVTRLRWAGATSGTCLKISKNNFFVLARIGVLNAVAEGTSIGIDLTGPAEVGTQTHVGTFDHVAVTGFHVGIAAGHYTNYATSEMVYRHLSLAGCGTGWANGSLNTLNHQFEMLAISSCGIGLDISSGNAYIDGGAASNNLIDFKISNSGMTCEIANFRSEGAARTRFLVQSASDFQAIRIVGCMVVDKGASAIAIEASITKASLLIEDSLFAGKINLTNVASSFSSFSMHRCIVFGDTAIYEPAGVWSSGVVLPFFVTGSNANGRTRLSLQANIFHDVDLGAGSDFTYADVVGNFHGSAGVLFPGLVRTADAAPSDTSRLLGIACLSQAPFGGVGKNLRLQGRFASAGTLALAFIRDITVSTSAGANYIDSAAAFHPADVGRQIVIDNADGIGGTATGVIAHFVDASQIYWVKTSGVSFVTGSGRTAHIGKNEPDAYYFAWVQGTAQETFAVTGKSSSAVTITSSNAASTATVDVLIVR